MNMLKIKTEVTAAGDTADEAHQALEEHFKHVVEAAGRHLVAIFGPASRDIDYK